MKTYLLTWNPDDYSWDDLPDMIEKCRQGIPHERRWSCGNRKTFPIGSRVFILRQGIEPKGIIGSGWISKEPFLCEHRDPKLAKIGTLQRCIAFKPDVLLNPDVQPLLDPRLHRIGPLAQFPMNTAAGGIDISDCATAVAEQWQKHLVTHGLLLASADTELSAFEGITRSMFLTHRSRERALRHAKLADVKRRNLDGRIRCAVAGCGFDFQERYGNVGADFAHVHHLRPLSESLSPILTRLEDLAVVCANCHAMIHRGGECRPIETLITRKENNA